MRTIRLKSGINFADQINNVTNTESDAIFVCLDEIRIDDEIVNKLKEILISNEHHAIIGPVLFRKSPRVSDNPDFFNVVPFISAKCFMFKTNVFKNSNRLNSEILDADMCLAEFCTRINSYGYNTIQAHFAVSSIETLLKLNGLTNEEMSLISKKLHKICPILIDVVENYLSFKEDPFVHFKDVLANSSKTKLRLLFSFQNLMASFNGTAEYSFALLGSFVKLYSDRYDIDVIVHKEAWSFHKNNFPKQISVYYFNQDEDKLPLYEMVFSSSQIWEMKYLYLFNRLSPRIVIAILDAIVWRSGYLDVSHASGHTSIVNRFIMRHCSGFLAISETARKDIISFFHDVDMSNLLTTSTLLGYDFKFQEENKIQDKILFKMYNDKFKKIFSKKYILIFGNGLKHKSIREAHDSLINIDMHKVYIGMDGSKFKNKTDESFFHSGGIPDSLMQKLYQNANLLIFPSQYEGFGLIILKAAEYGKKIILFNSEINREVVNEFIKNNNQAIFFDFFSQLPEIINKNSETYFSKKTQMRTWDEVARNTEKFFQKVIQTEINPSHLRDRWFNLKLMELESNNYFSLRKIVEWSKNFSMHATVVKKKFFPKKLF